jgi:hypothetical protein
MNRAENKLFLHALDGRFFEVADAQHLAVEVQQAVARLSAEPPGEGASPAIPPGERAFPACAEACPVAIRLSPASIRAHDTRRPAVAATRAPV